MSICCSLCNHKGIVGFRWYKKNKICLCRKCWPGLHPTVEWFENRYSVLRECVKESFKRKINLFKPLGLKEAHVGIEDSKWITERVIEHLSLPRGDINFEFKMLSTSIAGTVKFTGEGYIINISQDLQDNPRALSAIIIHELMHIYLSNQGLFCKSQTYEELTDLACVLLGFGIPLINAKYALHAEKGVLGCGDVHEIKYHTLGYLSQEQIGYAFAYFIHNNDIELSDVQERIDSQCWNIVQDGIYLESGYSEKVASRRKTMIFLSDQSKKKDICRFSCPVCFLKMGIPHETINRIGIFKTSCSTCGTKIEFDGKKIVRFIEGLK